VQEEKKGRDKINAKLFLKSKKRLKLKPVTLYYPKKQAISMLLHPGKW
jgi:hypothetical protein